MKTGPHWRIWVHQSTVDFDSADAAQARNSRGEILFLGEIEGRTSNSCTSEFEVRPSISLDFVASTEPIACNWLPLVIEFGVEELL